MRVLLRSWLLLPLAILARPAFAQDDAAPAGINHAQIIAIAQRIEASYPLPIDPQAIYAALNERGRELAAPGAARFDECSELSNSELRRLTFSMAVIRSTTCAVEGLDEDARGPILRQLAETLLGQLHGPNMLLDLDEEGQVPASSAPVGPSGLVTEQVGDVIVLRPEGMPLDIARDLREAARGDASAILIDLRGNEGGALDEVVGIADAFLADGEIVRAEGKRRRDTLVYDADEAEVAAGVPIGVLVDEASASGAEMIAAALQDHDRATVIGTRTMGSAAIRTLLPLTRQMALILVTGVVHRPSGELIDGNGVTPDCTLDPASEDFLARAAAIVSGLESCPQAN